MALHSVAYRASASPFSSFIFHEEPPMLLLRDRAQVSLSFLSGKKRRKRKGTRGEGKAKRHLLDVTRLLYSCQWFRIRVFEIILLRGIQRPTEREAVCSIWQRREQYLIKDVLANAITWYSITKLLCLEQLAGWYRYWVPFWRLLCGIKLCNLPACLVKSLQVGFRACLELEPGTSPSKKKKKKSIPKAHQRPPCSHEKWNTHYIDNMHLPGIAFIKFVSFDMCERSTHTHHGKKIGLFLAQLPSPWRLCAHPPTCTHMHAHTCTHAHTYST